MLCLVNKERSKNSLQPLGLDHKLTQAAQKHSDDQANHSNMSHSGSDGSDPGERITESGFQWRSYGENVAYGYNDEVKCMKEWMDSPGHRANILSPKVTKFGSAVAYNSRNVPYYTQEFGKDEQPATDIPKCDGTDYDNYNNYDSNDSYNNYDSNDSYNKGGGEEKKKENKKEAKPTKGWKWREQGGFVELSGYVPKDVLAVLLKHKTF